MSNEYKNFNDLMWSMNYSEAKKAFEGFKSRENRAWKNTFFFCRWGDSALLRIEVTQYVLKEENVIDNIKGSIELLFDDIINYDQVVVIKLITHLKHLSAVYHIENVRFPIEYGHYVNLLKDVFENVRILGDKEWD